MSSSKFWLTCQVHLSYLESCIKGVNHHGLRRSWILFLFKTFIIKNLEMFWFLI